MPDNDPVISFSETRIEIPAEGGVFDVGFSVDYPLEDGVMTASCSEEWASAEILDDEGCVRLTVSSSEESHERSAELCVAYEGTGFSAVVSIVQQCVPEPDVPFSITVVETGTMEVVFDIAPADESMTYIANVFDKEDYDAFDGDGEFVAAVLEYMEKYAQMYGKTLEEYLGEILLQGELKGGRSELLVPGNEMFVYAFGLDEEGNLLSEVVKEPFTTLKSEDIDVSFEISYEIDGPLVDVTVIPSAKDVMYLFDAVEKSAYSDAQSLRDEYQEFVLQMISFSGQTPSQYIMSVSKIGDVTIDAEYKASTEYVGFAVAVTEEGELISDMTLKEFVTEAVDESRNRLKITLENLTDSSVECNVSATNDDPYIFGWSDAAYWEGKTPNEIRDEIIETEYTRYYQTRNGSISTTIPFLEPGVEYIVFVFGFENGEATTDMVMEHFTTKEKIKSDVKFDISYDKYYDGDEMVALYPDDFSGAEGLAVLPVRAFGTPEEDVETILYHLVEGDYTDPSGAMSDADVINYLKGFGQTSEYLSFYLKYDTVFTIWGVSVDHDGNYGEVFRESVMLSRDGVSPAEEYERQ